MADPGPLIWNALDVVGNARDNRHAARVLAIMQRLGYPVKRVIRYSGKPTRCWLREGQSPSGDERRLPFDGESVVTTENERGYE